MPDIIYQRRRAPKGQYRGMWAELRQERLRINTVNRLGKWFAYRVLSREKDTVTLLPDTRRLTSVKDLEEMLKRHRSVLLKSDYGSHGKGIKRVYREEDETYSWQASSSSKPIKGLSLQQVGERALRLAEGRRLLVQQQISLLRLDDRLFDSRIHMLKDSSGKWQPVLYRLRLGQRNRFTTNWHQGGELMLLPTGLQQLRLPQKRIDGIIAHVGAVSRRVSEILEKRAGRMGEMGLDFALDENYRLWFIEANARPDKAMIPEEYLGSTPEKYSYVMAYAKHLWAQQLGR